MNNNAHIIASLFAEIQHNRDEDSGKDEVRQLRHRRHIRPLQLTVESHLIVPLAGGIVFALHVTATIYG